MSFFISLLGEVALDVINDVALLGDVDRLPLTVAAEKKLGTSGGYEAPDFDWWAVKDSNPGPAD